VTEEIRELEEVEKKYGHLLVVAFCASVLLVVLGCGIASPWFRLRLQSDFWPIDKATVAPNLLASFIIADVATLAAALFYPPFKKALDRGLSRHTAVITSHVSAENDELHAKLDHIIKHHPDIPDFKETSHE
jgi:ABC-type Fe3+ transport system permease subunit